MASSPPLSPEPVSPQFISSSTSPDVATKPSNPPTIASHRATLHKLQDTIPLYIARSESRHTELLKTQALIETMKHDLSTSYDSAAEEGFIQEMTDWKEWLVGDLRKLGDEFGDVKRREKVLILEASLHSYEEKENER